MTGVQTCALPISNAEGIEELSQANRLIFLGCDYGQGYYLSRPVPEAKALELMSK